MSYLNNPKKKLFQSLLVNVLLQSDGIYTFIFIFFDKYSGRITMYTHHEERGIICENVPFQRITSCLKHQKRNEPFS
jgi:hypothetical protein